MLQRIQTVFLILAAGFVMPLLYFPLGEVKMAEAEEAAPFYVYGLMDGLSGNVKLFTVPLFVLLSLSILLSFVTVLLYKNRTRQMLIGRIILVALLIFQVAIFYYAYAIISHNEAWVFEMSPVTVLPVVSVVFVILALRAIRKDEELVRSMDRIR
ncbi:MAG: DUF4293 domain-containing protein [Flavobacteriales bacterium]|nr:DUF4293 domain-containing protein [Flavobacteriales bacterium]